MIEKLSKENLYLVSPMAKKIWPDYTLNQINETLEKYIDSNQACAFIDIENKLCVGIALASTENSKETNIKVNGKLDAIHIKFDYQDQDLDKLLIDECIKWTKQKGCIKFIK